MHRRFSIEYEGDHLLSVPAASEQTMQPMIWLSRISGRGCLRVGINGWLRRKRLCSYN
jgi:hypothetical protein